MTTLRIAAFDDAETLAQLHEQILENVWSEADYQRFLGQKGFSCYLAFEDEKAVGFVLFQRAGESLDIVNIAVLPAFQRQGIGRLLLERLHSLGKPITLEVRHNNIPALHFYEAMGFQPIGRRSQYYRDIQGRPLDAIVMRYASFEQ